MKRTGVAEVEEVPIESLTPHPRNPNKGDVEAIAESIRTNTWYGVITAQRSTRRILAGEHRWRAAKQLGQPTVPVYWKDCDDVVAVRIMLADNATARRGRTDPDAVRSLLADLGSVEGTGYDPLLQQLADEEATEEATEEADGALLEPGEDRYESQYGVVVVCEDELHQKQVYEQLTELGLTVRVVAV